MSSENEKLRSENENLRIERDQLAEVVTKYLLEQTAIDVLGLKKYGTAWGLVKTIACNRVPSFFIC